MWSLTTCNLSLKHWFKSKTRLPARDAARVRAMYTHPTFTRRGIGRLILKLCEEAAREEGFARVDLMATLAGAPLYRACGYEIVEQVGDDRGGVPVRLQRMTKLI